MFKKISIALISTAALLNGCSNGEGIASVDGQVISQEMFSAYLAEKRIPTTNKKRIDSALDMYLEREALTTAIEESDVLDSKAIEAELNELKKQMLISRYFDQYLKNSVNEEAIRNFYSSNAEAYQVKRVHVAHILLRTRKTMDESEIAAVRTKAQEIYSKATSSADFTKLAEEYSEDKISAVKGGDLGLLNEGSVSPEFSKIAFSLEQDEISQIIQTPFGFHIIKSLALPQTIQKSFEAVKGDIRYQLKSQAKKAELERLLSTVKIEKFNG
ncbi:MAG: peptidylprolyl isomerase [Blastopirellula sp.]|nr:MAG: peptidylprolyl isomerase [Blastopirellula sp.]